MSNKDLVISFLNLAATGNIQEAYRTCISKDFIHHNQYFKGDRQSLLDAMEEDHKTNPNTGIEIRNVYEDGNTIITHSLVSKEAMEIIAVHIFRIENNLIAELWDVAQVIEANMPNENGIF